MLFLNKYIPQNSHEERLTGHLISEVASSLSIIGEVFKQKAFELYHSELCLDFHYADLSARLNERVTGADFGLIFHINLPDYQEKINVAIVQAKKLDKRGRIDIDQFRALENFTKEFGYYCFYDMCKQNSPLIQRADAIRSILHINEDVKEVRSLQRIDITDRPNGGIPLSVFLIFDMLNTENGNAMSFTDIMKAKKFINRLKYNWGNDTEPQISKVLVVSIGGISNARQEIDDLSRLFMD